MFNAMVTSVYVCVCVCVCVCVGVGVLNFMSQKILLNFKLKISNLKFHS